MQMMTEQSNRIVKLHRRQSDRGLECLSSLLKANWNLSLQWLNVQKSKPADNEPRRLSQVRQPLKLSSNYFLASLPSLHYKSLPEPLLCRAFNYFRFGTCLIPMDFCSNTDIFLYASVDVLTALQTYETLHWGNETYETTEMGERHWHK